MTINDAMNKVIVTARQFGYSDSAIAAFAYEIREKLYSIEDLTDDAVNDLIEEIF